MPDGPAAPAPAPRQPHPLFHVGKSLVSDLLSTLVFVGLYAAFHSIYLATGLAIAIGLGRIIWLKSRGKSVDLMQWLSLFLVVVFGGATLLTHDPVFVMVKPTLIYAAIGAVMLRRGWMNHYVPPAAQVHAGDLITTFGYVWAAMMFATSGANLAVARYASPASWAWFVGVVPLTSKIVLVAIQYVVTRSVVRRRIAASQRAAAFVE